MPAVAWTCIRSPGRPDRLSTSAGSPPSAAEPLRHPGVELDDLARAQHEVLVTEHEPHPPDGTQSQTAGPAPPGAPRGA
jgi:hypothetical protein